MLTEEEYHNLSEEQKSKLSIEEVKRDHRDFVKDLRVAKENEMENTEVSNYTDVEKNVEYDRTERAFSEKYESLAKIPLEKACQGDKIEGKDWDIIIDFVLLQFVRTPAFYLWIIDRGKEIIPPTLDTIADTLSELKSPPDISKIEAFNGVNLPLKIEKVKDNPKEDTIDLEIKTIIGKNTWLLIFLIRMSPPERTVSVPSQGM